MLIVKYRAIMMINPFTEKKHPFVLYFEFVIKHIYIFTIFNTPIIH